MKINKYTGLSAAVIAGLLLASCAGDDDDASGDGEPATIVVWDRAGAEADARQAFFEEWNAEEGEELGITVQYEPQATERYEEIVRLGFQTQRGPDIFHGPSSQMGGFVAAGWVQPLDGLVDDAVLEEASRYLPDTSELVWDGRPYAVPTTTFTVRTAINRGLFEQAGLDPDDPPETFSEVEEASRAIVEATNGEAYGVGIPMAWVGFQNWTLSLPILASNENLTQNGLFNQSTGEFEAELYEPIITHFQRLIAEGLAYPGAETMDNDTFLSSFAEGKVGMVLASGSIVGSIQNLGTEIDFGVGPIPVPDGETLVRSPMNAGFPYSISSLTEEPEAAAAVFEALVGPEMQIALAEGGIPPLSEEAWDSPAAQENEWLQLYRPTEVDEQWPKAPGSVISVEGEDAATAAISLIMSGSPDVAGPLQELSERYQQAYETGVENGEVDPAEFGL